ncbi:MAG: hypothetical protein ACHQM6_11030, partial [Candidatus Kapaibacterium sp.]
MTARRIRSTTFTSFVLCLLIASPVFGQGDASKKVLARGLSDTHFENLTNLNSSADDATPIVSSDEGTLYFTSYRISGKQVIYRSKRKSLTEWSDPEVFLEMPDKGSVSALSIAGDGRTCVLQGCNLDDGIFKSCDIYQAEIDE